MKTLTLAILMMLGLSAQAGTSTEVMFTYTMFSDSTTLNVTLKSGLAAPNAYKVRIQYSCGAEVTTLNTLLNRSVYEKPGSPAVTYYSTTLPCKVQDVNDVRVKAAPVVVLTGEEVEAK